MKSDRNTIPNSVSKKGGQGAAFEPTTSGEKPRDVWNSNWRPRVLFVAAVLLLLLLAARAGHLLTLHQSHAGLVVDRAEYDFGAVPQWTDLDHEFRVSNRGERSFVIERIEPCCGLSASLVGGTPEIDPGESRSIKISTGGTGVLGYDQRIIVVQTNDPLHPRISLKGSWTVVPTVAAVPAELDLGEVIRGDRRMRTVDLINIPRQFQIGDLESSSSALRTDLDETPQDAAFRRVRVQFDSSNLSAGDFKAAISITSSSLRQWPISIPVRATVVSDIDVHPAKVFLGLVGPGSRPTGQVTVSLRAETGGDLPVSVVPASRFRVTLQREADPPSYLVTVVPKSDLPPGRISDAIVLRAGKKTVEVPITGYVDPAIE